MTTIRMKSTCDFELKIARKDIIDHTPKLLYFLLCIWSHPVLISLAWEISPLLLWLLITGIKRWIFRAYSICWYWYRFVIWSVNDLQNSFRVERCMFSTRNCNIFGVESGIDDTGSFSHLLIGHVSLTLIHEIVQFYVIYLCDVLDLQIDGNLGLVIKAHKDIVWQVLISVSIELNSVLDFIEVCWQLYDSEN